MKYVSLIPYNNFVTSYSYIILKKYEIVWACDRHSSETVTLRKHVAKYKHDKIDGRISQQI